MIRFFHQPNRNKPRRLVAAFTDAYKEEADKYSAYLAYRKGILIEREDDPPTIKQEEKLASLQVDTTQAIPSNRTLSVRLSYHLKDQMRVYIATCTKGVIRGTVEDTVFGANKFWSRLKAVWPNAQLEK